MLPNRWLKAGFAYAYRIFLPLIFLILVAPLAFAQETTGTTGATGSVTAWTIIKNIAAQIPQLMQMITAIGYVMGMYFIIAGLFKLKQMGESRTMMSQEHGLSGPLAYIAGGALMLYLPTTVWVGMSTFWQNPTPYAYQTTSSQWEEFFNVIYLVVQFIGTIAFLRGLVVLSHIGERSGQDSFSKGITYVIGGILCINIYQFVLVILATLGIQSPTS